MKQDSKLASTDKGLQITESERDLLSKWEYLQSIIEDIRSEQRGSPVH
jgi:hypothetical protein